MHVTIQTHLHFYEGIPYAENNGGRTLHFKMKSGKLKEKRSIARCVPQAGEAMENKCVIKNSKTVDLFLFMGQSNMAGRGIVSEKWAQPAPQIMEGAGYEYRAISAPDKLYPLTEPFGRQENAEDGINDGNMKTGSLLSLIHI